VIENELRALLTDRADTVVGNPARVADVRDRITVIRHRRAAGAALALVLVALAGFALARLPGRPETLPTGSPAGPYFTDDGTSRAVDGYRGSAYFAFRGDAEWSVPVSFPGLRHALVARCTDRGDLQLANRVAAGPALVLRCRVPVGDHYEGALPIDETAYTRLVGKPEGSATVNVRPGSPGDWTVGVLEALFPDRIGPANVAGALLSGFGAPTGGQIPVTVPTSLTTTRSLIVTFVCGRGVQLELTVDGRPAGVATCDDAHVTGPGLVSYAIGDPVLQQLGLREGQRVSLGVRPVRPTDQWAVIAIG
jgi:hypothetical protein